jgi:hypothetical protein
MQPLIISLFSVAAGSMAVPLVITVPNELVGLRLPPVTVTIGMTEVVPEPTGVLSSLVSVVTQAVAAGSGVYSGFPEPTEIVTDIVSYVLYPSTTEIVYIRSEPTGTAVSDIPADMQARQPPTSILGGFAGKGVGSPLDGLTGRSVELGDELGHLLDVFKNAGENIALIESRSVSRLTQTIPQQYLTT